MPVGKNRCCLRRPSESENSKFSSPAFHENLSAEVVTGDWLAAGIANRTAMPAAPEETRNVRRFMSIRSSSHGPTGILG